MSNVLSVKFGTGQIRVGVRSSDPTTILLQELLEPQRIGKLEESSKANPETLAVALEFTSKKSVDVMFKALEEVRKHL